MSSQSPSKPDGRRPHKAIRVIKFLLPFLVLCAGPLPSDAKTLEQQRRLFLSAEEALEDEKRTEFARLSAQLEDYPLYPYLLYADLRQRLATVSGSEVKAFLSTYAETPLTGQLRIKWLDRLWRKHDWNGFLENWEPSPSTELQCRHLRVLLAVGETDRALSEVTPLWLSGRSQPKECDSLFDAWRAAGYQSRELVWQRIELAMAAGQPGLAKYLTRFLSPEDRQLVDTWRAVHANPARLLSTTNLGSYSVGTKIFLHGIARQARSNPHDAVRIWETLKDDYVLTDAQIAEARGRIGMGFALKHQPEAVRWLAAVDNEHSTLNVRRWRALSAVRFEHWSAAISAIDRLLPEEQSDPQWQYWRARALEALGQETTARAIYLAVAKKRNYYGFLAADRTGGEYRLNAQPLPFSPLEVHATVERYPGIVRARELYALDRRYLARREWYAAVQRMGTDEQAQVAQFAHDLGWHGRAIITVAGTPYLDALDLRFPLAYQDEITKQATSAELDPAWLFAVVRQESAFMPDARSPAGALGLMQIMPQTGKTIARSLNARLRTSNQLLEPATSIRFGSHYLRSLLDKFSGHPALASAAYNAGPRRVERWVSASEVVPGDVWVDTVPFTETREYVRRVFAYTVIYERRLGQQTRRLSDRLLPVLRNQVLSLANVSVRDNPETSNRLRPGRTLDGAVFTRRDPNLELRTSD